MPPPKSAPIPITSGKLRLLDHDGTLLRWIAPEEASEIFAGGRVMYRGTKRKRHALQFASEDRGKYAGPDPIRRDGIGDPHQRENDTNVEGVWSINRIPERFKPMFRVVTDGITRAA